MMEKINLNWFMVMILLPVIVAIFKAEIGRIFTSWSIYRLRAFDVDGDPNTPDQVQMLNGATGEWFTVTIVKYCMWTGKAGRGVHIKYSDGAKRKFSFLNWANEPKRTVPTVQDTV